MTSAVDNQQKVWHFLHLVEKGKGQRGEQGEEMKSYTAIIISVLLSFVTPLLARDSQLGSTGEHIEQIRPRTVITFGTFDVFHIGHLNILKRAKMLAHGGRLVVGVSSDALNIQKKGRAPVFSQEERMLIVSMLKCVDDVFLEESLEQKKEYITAFDADLVVMGDDWQGKFDHLTRDVVYLSRTPSISTTALIEKIQSSYTPKVGDLTQLIRANEID